MKHYKIYGATCYSFEAPVGKDQIVRVEFMPEEDDTEDVSTFYIGLLVYDKRKRNHALNRWIGLVNLDEDGYVRGDEYPITGKHQFETFAVARKLFLEGIENVRHMYCSSSLTFIVGTSEEKRARVYDRFLSRYGWRAHGANDYAAQLGYSWKWSKYYLPKGWDEFLECENSLAKKENEYVELAFD